MPTDIDARVAEEVMGFDVRNSVEMPVYCEGRDFAFDYYAVGPTGEKKFYPLPAYSTDMNAAMEVVATLEKSGLYMKLHSPFSPKDGDKPGYSAWFASFDWHGCADGNPLYQSWSDTTALAICLAALEAVKGA